MFSCLPAEWVVFLLLAVKESASCCLLESLTSCSRTGRQSNSEVNDASEVDHKKHQKISYWKGIVDLYVEFFNWTRVSLGLFTAQVIYFITKPKFTLLAWVPGKCLIWVSATFLFKLLTNINFESLLHTVWGCTSGVRYFQLPTWKWWYNSQSLGNLGVFHAQSELWHHSHGNICHQQTAL